MSAAVIPVSELNRNARRLLEQGFALAWVSGEVSNLTRATSGHVYFTLRDESAQVRCVMFRQRAQLVGWALANGQHVEVQARVTLYEPRGDFQLGIEGMRRAGLGRLFEAFNRLREQLAAEGLFDRDRKHALPRLPRTVGIVTSLQAAALRDVVATLRRRAPNIRLVVFATPVQGEAAAPGIASALSRAAVHGGADALLLVRGGGSMEDLWAFNEVQTARAMAACPIPIVAGIGHETDTTIADYVADVRAATPTAAAELISAGWFAAQHELAAVQGALHRAARRRIDTYRQRLDHLGLRLVHPATRVARLRDRVDALRHRLLAAVHRDRDRRDAQLLRLATRLERQRPDLASRRIALDAVRRRLPLALRALAQGQRQRIARCAGQLQLLDPQRTVARGYAIVRDANGNLVRHVDALRAGDTLAIALANGGVDARVTTTHPADPT